MKFESRHCEERSDEAIQPSSFRVRCFASPRNDGPEILIPPRGIDDVFKRAAGFKALDLARDIFRYFVGIGIGRVVRRQHDFWMGPERAIGRKRLIGENVERRGAERAVVKARQNVGFVLQPAAPGIDQDRRPQRAVPVEFCK